MPRRLPAFSVIILVFTIFVFDAEAQDAAEIEALCHAIPDYPGCDSGGLMPGFAKFTLGRAESVRWAGTHGCTQLDYRIGQAGEDNELIKARGEMTIGCDNAKHFEFIFRSWSRDWDVSEDATFAYRPLNEAAAAELLRSCSGESPDASVAVGQWWDALQTYAMNPMLGKLTPIVYATELIVHDYEDYELVDEESIDGIETLHFTDDDANLWLIKDDDRNRPVRTVYAPYEIDVSFTEWEAPFDAEIPEEMRELSEICP